MDIIDRSSFVVTFDHLTFMDRIRGSVKNGLSWPLEFEAQQACIDLSGIIGLIEVIALVIVIILTIKSLGM